MTRLHLPQAIVVVRFQDEAIDVAWSALPCGRYLLALSTGNEMVSRGVRPTPPPLPANVLYTPANKTLLLVLKMSG